jgi:hypothetical protein
MREMGTLCWSVTNDDGCFGPCAETVPVVARNDLTWLRAICAPTRPGPERTVLDPRLY